MTRVLEWLLDLDRIRIGRDAPLLLRWERDVPVWLLFCCGLIALLYLILVYGRERTSAGRRVLLGSVRWLVLALVIAVICRPSLVLQRNRVEVSHVTLLVDTSMSMAHEDVYLDAALNKTIAAGAGLADVTDVRTRSRLDLIGSAFSANDAEAVRALLSKNGVELCAFSDSVSCGEFAARGRDVDRITSAMASLSADGFSTDIAGAIRGVLEKSRGRHVAALVLVTDGRSTHASGLKDALDLAAGRAIPIYPIRIGSTVAPVDVEIGALRGPPRAFVNDVIAIEADLLLQGLTEPTWIRVSLIDETLDESGPQPVASETFEVSPDSETFVVELRVTPQRTGTIRYRVEVEPLANERILDNNTERIDVEVIDDRVRVLFVDAYPRYEYRYLKNALLREETLDLSVLLIEADEQFVQEGTEPIRRFPDTPEELSRFDVVFFGDVDPRSGWITTAQMNMLLDLVGNQGRGFALIAGERSAPRRFVGTPLQKLVPVRIDARAAVRADSPITSGFRPRLTPEGRKSRLFRFASDRAESEGLFDELPELYWIARTLGPKPGATVLAEHPTLKFRAAPRSLGVGPRWRDAMPVVVTGRYGAGKLFFQATDDTWRWRRHDGELLHDSYWVQVARSLMPNSRIASSAADRFTLRTNRRVYAYGASVRARVELLDPQLLREQGDSIALVLMEQLPRGDDDVSRDSRGAADQSVVARFEAYRIGPDSNVFEGSVVAPHPGGFSVESADLSGRPGRRSNGGESALIRVERPDLEMRRSQANHDVLQQIAAATGGSVIELDELTEKFSAIPDRSVQVPDDVTEPLWDSKLVLLLFVSMISLEWGLRKGFGLL